jgi:putative transposase
LNPPVYTSHAFGELCGKHGIVQSMGATGVSSDNSVAESWFGTMKRELAYRRRWATRAEARRDLIRWIEGWFNPRRLHSSNNYLSPVRYRG